MIARWPLATHPRAARAIRPELRRLPRLPARPRFAADPTGAGEHLRSAFKVAAHLHDSVLQTLALIQKRAGDPREVAGGEDDLGPAHAAELDVLTPRCVSCSSPAATS